MSHKKSHFEAFLLSFDDVNSFRAYMPLIKIFKIPLVFVADEFPIPIRDYMKDEVPREMLEEYRYFHNSFSARVLMTNALKEFYDKELSPKPTFILNTIIDASRFYQDLDINSSDKSYICYMGNMDLRKDNVQNIIEAFALIKTDFPELELHLYGMPSTEHYSYLMEKTKLLGISSQVFFKGRANYQDVPGILRKSKVLVNTQPITKRAQGGFPTKLGEYLLSLKPSVFTDSGDISLYLKGGKYVYFVEPENSGAYARTLRYILENYSEALAIAKDGEKFIRVNFDAKIQTKELIEFLEENLN